MSVTVTTKSYTNKLYEFMKSTRSFGHVAGIPLNVQMNWFPSILVVTWSIAAGYFPHQYPQWEVVTYWSVGLLTAGLFFLSVFLHELGHCIIAVREGIRVEGITLFLLGGMAHIAREPKTPGSEARVVAAGPLTSLLLSGVFYVTHMAAEPFPQIAAATLYMTYVNLILASFNLIPGFPLDGGRLLRALLWKLVNHYGRATRWAAIIGLMIGFTQVLAGLLAIVISQFVIGFWLMVVGLYLCYLARAGIHKGHREKERQRFTPNLKDYSSLAKQPVMLIEDPKK